MVVAMDAGALDGLVGPLEGLVGTLVRFDGETYNPARDEARLTSQLDRVYAVMTDGRWRYLSEIAERVDGSEASVSARLRDLRKPRFGGYTIERRYVADGLWEYRMLPPYGRLF